MRKLILVLAVAAVAITNASAQNRESASAANLKLQPVPAELQRRSASLHAVLKPTAAAWVAQQARIEEKRPSFDVNELNSATRQRFASTGGGGVHPTGPAGPGGGGDVAAMVVLVMMQMVQDGDQDLQQKMQQAQAQMQAKQALRLLQQQATAEVSAAKTRPAGANCTSAFCQGLPAQLAQISSMTASQAKPIRLQAPAHITNAQLGGIASQIQNALDSENEISEMTSMQLQMLMDTRSKLLETASNMEKSMSDTDAAIVANMK